MKIIISYIYRFIFPLALLFLIPACFDEIQLDLPQSQEQKMVIEGYVNKGNDYLDVFFLAGVNADISALSSNAYPVPVARAFLIYNDIAFPEFELNNNQITRLPLQPFESQAPGDGTPTFSLHIELNDGRLYQSAPDKLLPVPKAESIDIRYYTTSILNNLGNLVAKEYMEVKLTTPLQVNNEEKALLKWEMDGVYQYTEAPPPLSNPFEPQNVCYLNSNLAINQILLFNGRETTENMLSRYPVLRDIPVDFRFSAGFYLTIYQQSLSEQAYLYWDQLRQNANRGGGLFEPSPGSVKSNIKNINNPDEPVLGFFYASQVDTLRRLIKPEEVNRPRIRCYNESFQESTECVDCTTIRGSTMERPDYWID